MNINDALRNLERRVARLTGDEWSPEARRAAAEARRRKGGASLGGYTEKHEEARLKRGLAAGAKLRKEHASRLKEHLKNKPAGQSRAEAEEAYWDKTFPQRTKGRDDTGPEYEDLGTEKIRAQASGQNPKGRDEWSPQAREKAAAARRNHQAGAHAYYASVNRQGKTPVARPAAGSKMVERAWGKSPAQRVKAKSEQGDSKTRVLDSLERRVHQLTVAALERRAELLDLLPLTRDEWSPQALEKAAEVRRNKSKV